MSSGEQQLVKDFEQVQKLLEIYPNIKIIKTEGDPPEQYDIEYTIKGYKTNDDGTASPDNRHEVHIALPFGYPHFPPTAKPITPIFHPDIDPDAIRIGDFWQENQSLPDLIIHIGQMICGNHYTKEEPFNQNAFEWFEERKSWLPFDILEPRDEDDIEEIVETETGDAEPSGAETKQTFVPATDLDILKDDIDFSFDEDEESDESEDAFSFEIVEDIETDDLTSLDSDETTEDLPLDFGEEESAEPFNLQETRESETDDLFNLESDEVIDDFSFDLEDEPEKTASVDETPPTDDLFDLATETSEETGEETVLEFDADDITSAFEKDKSLDSEESEAGGISLDDLAGLDGMEEDLDFGIADDSFDISDDVTSGLSGLEEKAVEDQGKADEEEDALDFAFDDDSMDIGGDATADLSGLEEEMVEEDQGEETDPESSETANDEDNLLSALSLDQDFSSPGKQDEQAQIIRSLIDQKQIFSAKKAFADLTDPDLLPETKELGLTIADAVSEAENLFKKADHHEQKGELEKAGIILDLVANIATDFPGLEFARNRIRDSMMDVGKKKPDASSSDKDADQSKEEDSETSAIQPEKKKARARLSFKVPARLIVIILAGIALGGIGAGTAYFYNRDSENIQLATTTYQKAEQLVGKKEFKSAQNELDAARAALKKVLIFQGSEKESLSSKISELADSNLFKEGLQGRVLYGDKYVSVEAAKALDKFNRQKNSAEQALKEGKIAQAITAYEQSLPYAEKAGFVEQAAIINGKIIELRLELLMVQAKQSEEKQDWLNAEKAYQGALELSKNISTPEVQNEISTQLATASYHYGLQEGLKAVNDSQWEKSIEIFQSIQKVLEANPQIVPEAQITEIDKLLVQSRLYFELAEARKAYEDKEWKRAIDIYNDAIALLEKNPTLLGQEAKNDIKKIEKTILTTRVSREQVLIATTSAENALDKTVEHYKAIVNLIEKSSFKDDETLAKILDDARTKTREIKNQLLVTSREKWLTDNYDKIFRDNYPSAKLSDLMNPKVRFIKREGNIMIFNMSCSERKQGSTFRLELNYQHDLDKNAWSLYSGKIEEEQTR